MFLQKFYLTWLPNIWEISQNRGIYIRFWISRLTQWARAWYKQKPSRMSTSTKRSLKDFDCINNLPVKASFSIFIVIVFFKVLFLLQLKETKSTLKGETTLQFNDEEAQMQLRFRRIMVSFPNFLSNVENNSGLYWFCLSSLCDCSKKVTLHSQIIITIWWLT